MQQLLRYKHFTCRDVEDTGDGFGASAWVHPNPVDLVLLHPELGIVPAVIMLGLAVLLVILLPTLLLIEEDGPAVVPDRGGDAREAERRVAIHDKGLANPELIR